LEALALRTDAPMSGAGGRPVQFVVTVDGELPAAPHENADPILGDPQTSVGCLARWWREQFKNAQFKSEWAGSTGDGTAFLGFHQNILAVWVITCVDIQSPRLAVGYLWALWCETIAGIVINGAYGLYFATAPKSEQGDYRWL
jgi:hypothetical protein